MDRETVALLRVHLERRPKGIQVGRTAGQRLAGQLGDDVGIAVRCNDRRMGCRHHIVSRQSQDAGDHLGFQRLPYGQGPRRRDRCSGCDAGGISLDLDTDEAGRNLERRFHKIRMQAGEDEGGTHHRMPCKGHLGRSVEDADARRVRRIGWRQHEGGLAEIELGSDRLHGCAIERFTTENDREWIAAEAGMGEHIRGEEQKRRHGAIPL